MSPFEIERIVGIRRSPTRHYARAVSAEQTVYILHSAVCVRANPDLRDCGFSRALDNGIEIAEWDGMHDRPIRVTVFCGFLIPMSKL